MVIAGNHEYGNGGDHHGIKCKQDKPRKRGVVFLIENRKKQHRQGRSDHHVKRYHVEGEHRLHDDVFDQIEPVGQQKQNDRVKYDGIVLPHENALLGGDFVDPYSENAVAKAPESGKSCPRYSEGYIPHYVGSVPFSFHMRPPQRCDNCLSICRIGLLRLAGRAGDLLSGQPVLT